MLPQLSLLKLIKLFILKLSKVYGRIKSRFIHLPVEQWRTKDVGVNDNNGSGPAKQEVVSNVSWEKKTD